MKAPMSGTEEFYRIQKLPPYVFAVINEMRQRHGQPKWTWSISAWVTPMARPRSHRRQARRSRPQSAQPPLFHVARHSAIARGDLRPLQAQHDVDLDSEKEAIVTIGAKDALAHLLFATIGPGDIVASPNPAYPIHQYGVIMAEGHAHMLPMPTATNSSTASKSSTASRPSRRRCC
jgi:alanine-synthesizing transaminase